MPKELQISLVPVAGVAVNAAACLSGSAPVGLRRTSQK